MGCDHNASGFRCARIYSLNHYRSFYRSLNSFAFETGGNATVTTTCQGSHRSPRIRRQRFAIERKRPADRRQMRIASSALCSAATALGADRIDILPSQGNAVSRGLAIDDPQRGCRDFLLPFRPRRDHLGSASMATAITKMLGAPVRGTRFERTGGPAHGRHAQRR
jgi:hypothetical protein